MFFDPLRPRSIQLSLLKRGDCEEPARFALDLLFDNAAAIIGMQRHGGSEFSNGTIVIRSNDFVIAAFDPFEWMLVPSKEPAHIARLAFLTRSAVWFRDVSEFEFGQTGVLVQPVRVCYVSPQFVWRSTDRNLPDKLQLHRQILQ